MRTNELKSDTTVQSFPEAITTTLKDELKKYHIDKRKTIILHIGSNDAYNGDDVDSFFCDNYIALLETLASDDHRLIVSGPLPRKTANLESNNNSLDPFAQNNDIEFVDHFYSFILGTDKIPTGYFWKTKCT